LAAEPIGPREEAGMARIRPFHSILATDRAVHHDNTDCEEGASIPWPNRRDGDGGRPRCGRCEELDRADGHDAAGGSRDQDRG
jgi:hypothetical protein